MPDSGRCAEETPPKARLNAAAPSVEFAQGTSARGDTDPMSVRLRRFALAALVGASAAAFCGCGSGESSAERAKPVSIYAGACNETAGKPSTIVIDCAKRDLELMRLDWKRWGGSSATASGQLVICSRDCALSGTSDTYRVVVTARGLRDCASGNRSYTQLDYRPAGTSRDTAPPDALGTHRLGCEPAAATPAG